MRGLRPEFTARSLGSLPTVPTVFLVSFPSLALRGPMPIAFLRCWPAAGPALILAALVAPLVTADPVFGQAKASRESSEIEAYTGPPIYLPEVEAPPEPKEVDRTVIKENFPDTETPRLERRVVKLSDNTVLSDGPSKEFYSNGQLYSEGQYKLGKVTGSWTYYHPNGQVAKEVAYADGKPSGEVKVFNEEGKVVAKREYAAGRRAGVWEVYNETGEQKTREDHYQDGKANGVFKVWYDNGQIRREVPFANGKQDGVAKEWTRIGDKRAEVSFKDGLKDGKAIIWQRDGKTVEQVYEAGKLIPKE